MSLPEIPAGSQYVEGDEARRAPRFGQNTAATRTPLVRDGDRSTVVYRRGFPMRFARAKFEIPSYYAPLEMNFVLVEKKPPTAEFPDEEGAVVYDMPKRGTRTTRPPHSPCRWAPRAAPVLGARARSSRPTAGPGWCNFAAQRAAGVALFLQWLWRRRRAGAVELAEPQHRTGDVWRVALVGCRAGAPMPSPTVRWARAVTPRAARAVLYGWKVDGDGRSGEFHPGWSC